MNRSTGKLLISVRNDHLASFILSIFNERGQVVAAKYLGKSDLPASIGIAHLVSGTYIIQAMAKSQIVFSQKIIIAK
jgi:hypothetical protein